MESYILNFETPTGTEILITLLQNVLLLKLIIIIAKILMLAFLITTAF